VSDKGFNWGGKPEPSGFLNDFDGVIESALFQEGEYGVQLVLSVKNIDPEYTGENQPVWYSLGKGDHVVLDGGLRVGGTQYKQGSKLDLFIQAAVKLGVELPAGDSAAVWEGQTFHWERKTMSELSGRKIEINGREPDMLAPTNYLGQRAVTTLTDADSVADDAVQNALIETLKASKAAGKGSLTWPALMMLTINSNKELKAAIAKEGRGVLKELVSAEIVGEEDGKYSLEMDF